MTGASGSWPSAAATRWRAERSTTPILSKARHGEVDGLGLLDIETTFGETKTTCQVEAKIAQVAAAFLPGVEDGELKGYEIHMGESTGDIGLFEIRRLSGQAPGAAALADGSARGQCWGTYIHGIFENDAFRRGVLNGLREKKGLAPLPSSVSYTEMKERALDRLADLLRLHVDIGFIRRILGL